MPSPKEAGRIGARNSRSTEAITNTSGTTATTATQPIATYSPVDSQGWRSRFISLMLTPAAAAPHTTPSSVQPQGPCSTPRVKGV